MKITACTFAQLLRLAIVIIPMSAYAGVMDLSGRFAVDENGSASYRVPIKASSGSGGVEPRLELTYSSRGWDGMLGVGWSLTGLSSITRCPRTIAQDGTRGGINWDGNDRFCMDGQRLIATSGAYGAIGSEYKTEKETFSKIVSYAGTPGDPGYFKVWTKDGLVIEFGNTSDSRVEAQGKTVARVWAQNKVTDRRGNYLTLSYIEDTVAGEYVPSQIDYTGNSNTGLVPYNSVHFEYEVRPDVSQKYAAGVLMQSARRLKTIASYSNASKVFEYRIVYSNLVGELGRSRIVSLSECEIIHGTCKPPIAFTWSEIETGNGQASQWRNTGANFIADVTGDGLADLITQGSDGLYVSASTGTGVGPSVKWVNKFGTSQGYSDQNYSALYFVDLNGDGRIDVHGSQSGEGWYALSTGNAFDAPVNSNAPSSGNLSTFPQTMADVNGDGRPDMVWFMSPGVAVSVFNGTSYPNGSTWRNEFGTATTIPYVNSDVNPRFVIDVNGDGRADIVGIANDGIHVSLSTGSAFSASTLWLPDFGVNAGWTNQDTYPRTLADINGDGLPDIVGFKNDGVYVSINTGVAFQAPVKLLSDFGTATSVTYSTQKGFPRYLADMNGDGRVDIVGFAADGVRVSLSNGSGFQPSTLWVTGLGSNAGYTTSTPRLLGDMDGDGFPDFVAFKPTSTFVSQSNRTNGTYLITKFDSGIGAAIDVAYGKLVSGDLYERSSSAVYPQVDLFVPLNLVASVKMPNALGNGYVTTSYKYSSLRADINGRGLLGFAWVRATQVEQNIATQTSYRQDWPFIGLPSRVLTYVPGSSSFLSSVTNIYDCKNPSSGAVCTSSAGQRYFPYLSQSTEARWDANGATLPVLSSTYTYDIYGNPTQIIKNINDGTSTTVTNTYTNDTTNWILGRLARTQVTETNGGTPGGGSNGLFYFNPIISSNVTNYNLKNAAVAAGWNQSDLLISNIIINSGVVVGSTSTSSPAFDTGLGIPADARLNLTNYGSIIGRGGNGGPGGSVSTSLLQGAGNPGLPGGPGLKVQAPLNIANYGTIAGGGGGGGGGCAYKANIGTGTSYAAGSGGGGGAGISSGGAGGTATQGWYNVNGLAGSSGTQTAGGAGGPSAAAWNQPALKTNVGGNGGGLGAAGNPGGIQYVGLYGCTLPSGGAPGNYVIGSQYVTWSQTGTRLGGVQ